MNIKQIAAGSLAALTAGATMLFAAFASPAGLGDYVKTDTNAITSPIIVIGAPTQPIPDYAKDVVGAADIAAAVAGYATKPAAVAGVTAGVTGGVLITSDLNKAYVGTTGNFSGVRSTLTATELPDLLASGTISVNQTDITYQQLITLGTHYVQFGRPGTYTTPQLYVEFPPTTYYNTTVYFLGGVDTSGLDTTKTIKLFGNDLTFGPAAEQSGTMLTMYSTAGAITLNLEAGAAEQTVTVGNTSYTVKMTGWADCAGGTQGAVLLINNQATTPSVWCENTIQTWPGTTTKVRINDVTPIYQPGAPTYGSATAQLFIGTKKIELINGQPVEIDDVVLPQTRTFIDNSSTRINSVTVRTAPTTTEYLLDGGSWKDPVWGTFKYVLNGMTPAIDANRDTVEVAKSGNGIRLTWTNYAGTQYNTNVFYYDTSASTFERTVDGTRDFRVQEVNISADNTTRNISTGDFFVLSRGVNSYILQYDSYSGAIAVPYVQFSDASTGTQYKVYLLTDPYIRIGADTFRVLNLSDDTVVVDLDGDGDLTTAAYVNISTRTGAVIDLSTEPAATWASLNVTESPLFTIGNDPSGTDIAVNGSWSANEIGFAVSGTGYQVGTANKYEYLTSYGTHIATDTDADTVIIHYPGSRPAYANVALGADPQIGVVAGVETAVKIQQPVAKLADEIDTTALTGDLILLGGPCANSLVAELMAADNVTCEPYNWPYTKGVIKEYANAFGSGRKALVVAGTLGADTRELAAKVMQGTLSFSQ